jgi:GT2 family glycosyltransferase
MNLDVTIIILTHKSKKLVINYIKHLYQKFKIIIVDNSNDTELELFVKNIYPDADIHLISNNGYSDQINYGVKFVKTEYFLISNPDVQGINEPNIQEFVNVAKKLNNKFSVLGPRYLDVNPKSLKQSKSNIIIAEMRFLSGACMFFYKKNYDSIGGFDNNYFLYFEENDYCFRSKKFYKNYQINKIKVYHDAGNSVLSKNVIEIEDQRELRSWHFVWSKFYYYRKNYSFLYAFFFFIPIIIRTGIKVFYYSVKKDKINYLKYRNRWSGMMSSIKGEKSHKRPKF